MDVFLYSNKGGKNQNEDYAGYETTADRSIFAVADGLGGCPHGELASKCAVETLLRGWRDHKTALKCPEEWLREQATSVNDAILKIQEERQCAVKTTLVTLILEGEHAFCANTGDSRLYYIHGRMLEYVTEDHSVAYKKYKAGEIPRYQVGIDEDQSCLLRSLGSKSRFEPDIHTLSSETDSGDAFLLCTDGAWGYLQDEEILFDLLKAKSARQWTELLLLRIMERLRDAADNLTILSVIMEARSGITGGDHE